MIMKLLLLLAVAFLTVTAHPVQQMHQGSYLPQDANQAEEKTHVSKDQDGMWKSQVENADLYSQDPLSPLAEASLQKPVLSEGLRARLRQQLAELRARLWPQAPATSPQVLAGVRSQLAPLTEQLQGALSANLHQLCAQLRQHLQAAAPGASEQQGAPSSSSSSSSSFSSSAQQALLLSQVGRSLEASVRKMSGIILEFRARSAEAAERARDADERELLLEVAGRLSQEAAALEEQFHRRVTDLQASLGSLAAPPLSHGDGHGDGGDESSSTTASFCQHTRALIQQFSQDLQRPFTQLEQRPAGGQGAPAPPLLREDFLREDFTSRLATLLQEIMQTLN